VLVPPLLAFYQPIVSKICNEDKINALPIPGWLIWLTRTTGNVLGYKYLGTIHSSPQAHHVCTCNKFYAAFLACTSPPSQIHRPPNRQYRHARNMPVPAINRAQPSPGKIPGTGNTRPAM